jgi:hypothetical protein
VVWAFSNPRNDSFNVNHDQIQDICKCFHVFQNLLTQINNYQGEKMELKKNGKILIVITLFRLLFGGYLVGNDLYLFSDAESTLQVLIIYALIGLLATLVIAGKRFALFCLIGLDILFLIAQLTFTILSLSNLLDPGLNDPLTNWWSSILMVFLSLKSLIISFKAIRETRFTRVKTITA